MTLPPLPAILWVMLDVDSADEDELYRWYDEEHIPIRMDLPGWARARRFVRSTDPVIAGAERVRKHLTIYEVESTDAFRTPEYAAQYVEKTPWSSKVVPTQRNVMRSYYRAVADVGTPTPDGSGAGAVIAMFDSSLDDRSVVSWFTERYAPAALADPVVRRVRHYVTVDVPWPGGKWMQPEAGRRHLLVHEVDAPSAFASPEWELRLVGLADGSTVGARRLMVGGFTVVGDQSAPSGWFARAGGAV